MSNRKTQKNREDGNTHTITGYGITKSGAVKSIGRKFNFHPSIIVKRGDKHIIITLAAGNRGYKRLTMAGRNAFGRGFNIRKLCGFPSIDPKYNVNRK